MVFILVRHDELSMMLHNIRWLIGRVIFHRYYKPCLALGVSGSLMLFWYVCLHFVVLRVQTVWVASVWLPGV